MRRLTAIIVVLVLLFSSQAQSGELGDLLWDVLQHPQVLAAQNHLAASNRRLAATTARYLGRGEILAETSRFEDKRFAGVFSPEFLASP